jgi:hypothetical protein
MNQEEMINEYLKMQIKDWLEEDKKAMIREFPQCREDITNSLSMAIRNICYQAQSLQITDGKGPIGYLCISFLRTNVLEDNWNYHLAIYDESYYMDRVRCVGYWEFNFLWSYLKNRLYQLTQSINSSIYVNKTRSFHLDKIKITLAAQYHQIGISFIQGVINKAIDTPEYDALLKGNIFRILMGEYFDNNVLLYEKRKEKDGLLCNSSV